MVDNTFKINETDLVKLEKLLKETPIVQNDNPRFDKEIKQIYNLIPALLPNSKETHLLPHIGKDGAQIRYYVLTNKKLNEHFKFLFNQPNARLFVISEVTYSEGGYALPHLDPDSKITYNIMLDDNFEGGDVYLEGTLQDFKKRGDVVFFNGAKQLHEVKEITKGKRKILSIWSKPSSVM